MGRIECKHNFSGNAQLEQAQIAHPQLSQNSQPNPTLPHPGLNRQSLPNFPGLPPMQNSQAYPPTGHFPSSGTFQQYQSQLPPNQMQNYPQNMQPVPPSAGPQFHQGVMNTPASKDSISERIMSKLLSQPPPGFSERSLGSGDVSGGRAVESGEDRQPAGDRPDYTSQRTSEAPARKVLIY